MISNYEIRENSLTPNSVFILLIKGDEQGCDDILKEFQDICKQIDNTIEGFDYTFELLGITDDYMLEKIRGRLEFMASSVLGISQTFGNKSKTETISIDKTLNSSKVPLSSKNTKNSLGETLGGTYTQKHKEITVNLANTGFIVTNEQKEEVNFKDIKADSSLVSGDEKKIDIKQDSSLRLAQTFSSVDLSKNLPSAEQENNQPEIRVQENLSKVEKENQTIPAYSPEEIKDVSISLEKGKTGLFGSIFSKIKSAINSRSEKTLRKVKNPVPKEEKSLSSLLGTEDKKEQVKATPVQTVKSSTEGEENPFQDLGEGIIIKKGKRSEETSTTTAKQELSASGITAKLQVDDIFAAETICDFYGNPQEAQQQENNILSKQQESPLDKLEKFSPGRASTAEEVFSEKQSSSEINFEEEIKQEPKIEEQVKSEEIKISEAKATETKATGTFTLPDQIFTKGDIKREQQILSPQKEILPMAAKIEKKEKTLSKEKKVKSKTVTTTRKNKTQAQIEDPNENSLPSLEKIKTKSSSGKTKRKKETSKKIEEPKVEESKGNDLPGLDSFKGKASIIVSGAKEEKISDGEDHKEKTLPGLEKLEVKTKVSTSNEKETESKENFETQEKDTHDLQKEIKEGEKNMPEQNNENKIISDSKEESALKIASAKNVKVKRNEKIDHTLHIAAPAKDVKYRNYPIEMPLIPTYTFANMDISAIRFAHAMAMATLDDLGRSNNPLLVQGISGTGKTHFLHALGYEISKKIPQSKILFTNGVRFSRGVQYLLEKGQKDKLDEFFNNAQVLLVDDVHLTAVNEHNREYISKVLNDFLKNKKQIILSSKYPPESLKRFEELVNFKFSLGTITELKVPNKIHFAKLTNKIVSSSFLDLTEQQVQAFFSDQCNSLGDVARNVKRVKVLSRMIESSGIKKLSYEDLLKEMTAINGENSESEIIKKDFEDITVLERNKESSWGNFGFFFPVSHIDKFRWVAFAFQEAAKELGIKGGFNYALKSAYSTEHIISAAFKIANICDLKGLKGAIIVGPSPVECKEPIRDNFYDILTHMLEVMMIRCGTINFEDIKKPSAYIKMLGDILK